MLNKKPPLKFLYFSPVKNTSQRKGDENNSLDQRHVSHLIC